MGNVFEDLGFADAGELTLKAQLAREIYETVARLGLSQRAAGKIMSLPQSKVSKLMNCQLDGFSSDKLLHCLTALGRDVEIRVKKTIHTDRPARISVAA